MQIFKQYLIAFIILCAIFVIWTFLDVTTIGFETDPVSETINPKVFNPNGISAPPRCQVPLKTAPNQASR